MVNHMNHWINEIIIIRLKRRLKTKWDKLAFLSKKKKSFFFYEKIYFVKSYSQQNYSKYN